MTMQTRRLFFKRMASLTGAALLAPHLVGSVAQAEEQRRAKKDAGGAPAAGGNDLSLPLVEPGKGIAASLNYQHSHSEIKDAALKVTRNDTPFEQQTCAGCMLYTNVGKKDSDEVGKCQLFQGNLVKSKGWCASWQKKIAAK